MKVKGSFYRETGNSNDGGVMVYDGRSETGVMNDACQIRQEYRST